MKRKYLQVFIICILIINNLITIYSFGQQKEEKRELFNWGEAWVELGSTDKKMYLMGMKDGILYLVMGILDTEASGLTGLSDIKQEMFIEYYFQRYIDLHDNLLVLKDVITNLYKDPANSYISFLLMADIAMRKLKGEDVDNLLREKRKEALLEQN